MLLSSTKKAAANQVYDFVVSENGVNHECRLTANGSGYELTMNGKDQLSVSDTFTLFDEVITTTINENELTLQLISRSPTGEINLQYLGTKVIRLSFCLNVFSMF
jgi:hypothetical protein